MPHKHSKVHWLKPRTIITTPVRSGGGVQLGVLGEAVLLHVYLMHLLGALVLVL